MIIHLFKKFKIFEIKLTYLDENIKRKLKLKNFKIIFQINKIIEFEIHSKKLKFHKT